jgi:hypothetical protein
MLSRIAVAMCGVIVKARRAVLVRGLVAALGGAACALARANAATERQQALQASHGATIHGV